MPEQQTIYCVCVDCLDLIIPVDMVEIQVDMFVCVDCYERRCKIHDSIPTVIINGVDIYA